MTQYLLMTPKAGSVRATRCSRCLLQYSYLGFRFVRSQCSPWMVLAIAPLKWLFASAVERTQVKIRYFSAIIRINFVRIYSLVNNLLC
jgi:hypothetical protein